MAALPSMSQLNQWLAFIEAQPGWRRIGEVLVELGYVSQSVLDATLTARRREGTTSIGLLEDLMQRGIISPDQARYALTEQLLAQYLPALVQSIQREKEAVQRAEKAQQELAASYQTAIRTIEGLNERVRQLERQVALRSKEVAS